jgi:hypothetical protein
MGIHSPGLDEAYRQPGSYSYSYKNPALPGAGQGRFAGPMAQELEGIPGVVRDTQQGKMVDTPRLTMANTSEVANLRREVDDLKSTAAALGDDGKARPKAKPRAAVNTSSAPTKQGVGAALKAFGDKPPSEREIALAREDLRAKFGSASASEFERYAMAMRKKGKGQKPWQVKTGEAQDIYTASDEADFRGRMKGIDEAQGPDNYTAVDEADFKRRMRDVYAEQRGDRS